jgi:hypothetical protein
LRQFLQKELDRKKWLERDTETESIDSDSQHAGRKNVRTGTVELDVTAGLRKEVAV